MQLLSFLGAFFLRIFLFVCTCVGVTSLVTYFIMILMQIICSYIPNNLKKKYNADWALVTGSSSGIGKALAEKLAAMDLNIVIVALDTPDLPQTVEELQKKFPERQFRKVAVNLGDPMASYMDIIKDSTNDIRINLIFNNAGYILPGMIPDTAYEKVRANVECNAISAISITNHFLTKIMERKERGLVEFTSSSGGYFPGPTASTYSCTKAFITNFAASIAADIKDAGIDVIAMHPSPVMTNFYTGTADQMSSLKMAMKQAVPPSVIADQIIAGAGRITIWDQGPMSAAFRVINKVVDFAFLVEVITRLGYLAGDHSNMVRKSVLRNGKSV